MVGAHAHGLAIFDGKPHAGPATPPEGGSKRVVPRCRSPWGNGACSYRGGISAVPSRRPPTHQRETHRQEKKGSKK